MNTACISAMKYPLRAIRFFLLAALAMIAGSITGIAASADAGDLSGETRACLKCHDKPGLKKALANGEVLSLHISTGAFAKSTHAPFDCANCHSGLDAARHGKTTTPLQSRRAYSLTMRESCRDCHKENFDAYDDGVHAALISAGSEKAPLCSDCHDPHTQQPMKAATSIDAVPCAKCHTDIFKAYSADVHGLKRAANVQGAPLCADCHKAHDVKAASLGTGIKDACLSCHKDAFARHQDWLPNTARHFEAISCPACHVPDAKRRVNLRMFNAQTKTQIAEKTGVPQFMTRTAAADAQNIGLDERALLSLLKEFNQEGGGTEVVLRGRLEVISGMEAHQIGGKAKAIKDCDSCHRAGAEPFQSVTLTIAGPDGRPLRHGVNKEVLTSLVAIESVRGFYAIGANRIKLLDVLLVLALAGSIAGPLTHMTVKWLFRRARERNEAARLEAQAQGQPDDNATSSRRS